MKRKSIIVLSLATLMIITSLTACVQAAPKETVTRRQIGTSSLWYTQTTFVLGGALDAIKIPDSWNGKLVMLCRGGLSVDLNAIPMDLYTVFLKKGFATAASTYGVNGMCVKEGVIRTHQLTEYVVDNYDVTGNVYLFGMSLGGSVALELGAKYPDVYSGVLDMSGLKNMITQYNDAVFYSSIANNADLIAALLAKDGLNPPFPMPTIAAFRDNEVSAISAFINACGGTPKEKIQAYERISPTFSATDITVPTITVHGTKDGLAPYSTSLEFMNAVATAGHSDMYRLYKVVNGQHGDPSITNQISSMLDKLVNWAEEGTIPSASTP